LLAQSAACLPAFPALLVLATALLVLTTVCLPAFPALLVLTTSAVGQSSLGILPSISVMRISALWFITECFPSCDPIVLQVG
jgi:hypothetical protein